MKSTTEFWIVKFMKVHDLGVLVLIITCKIIIFAHVLELIIKRTYQNSSELITEQSNVYFIRALLKLKKLSHYFIIIIKICKLERI